MRVHMSRKITQTKLLRKIFSRFARYFFYKYTFNSHFLRYFFIFYAILAGHNANPEVNLDNKIREG